MKTTTWTIDPQHSEITFKVKHLVISTITGSFGEFEGNFISSDEFEGASISFETSVNSISTNNAQRDEHLKSADFFEADRFPKLSFKSTSFIKSGRDTFELKGNLSIKGKTRPVALAVEYGGSDKDPWGNTKAGFEIKGAINRKDFGLTWNAATETGGLLVGEEVKIIANVQLLKEVAVTA
ncbi:YceI family protein [Flavobacterium tructae]|uniref:YceI family protein n=1 Tax=Flavobacterium tructae TaxID=1114873 RepID=UPI002551CF92|nr:YceI family protein [Flavobacterium tructae]MDL2141686.1 YceI family protein [Flavobacterium tructae]